MADRRLRRRSASLLPLLLALGACTNASTGAAKQLNAYTIEKVAGTDIVRLHLEPKAVERIELRAEPVLELASGGATTGSRTIPYGALLYKADGSTFVYTQPEATTFVRHPVTVERVDGDRVVVTNGPAAGTPVVTDGAAELWGVEFGVGK